MAEAGISPSPALKRLRRIRHTISFMRLGMAYIYGMLGDSNEMRALLVSPERDSVLWAISAYIYCAEAYIRKGEDPTLILEEAGIAEVAKRGYLELARARVEKFPDDGWSKSRVLAELAKEEAKRVVA